MNEGLAQGPCVVARVGFEPATLGTQGTEPTEPPRPTIEQSLQIVNNGQMFKQ